MTVNSRALSPAHSDNPGDVETLQILGIFSGAGLLVSLLLAMSGWM
jgi:hypothetical protein